MHHPTLDDHGGDVDLRVDVGAVADDQGVRAANFAPKAAVDAYTTLELQFSFEMRAPTEESGDFGRGKGSRHGATIAKKKRRE